MPLYRITWEIDLEDGSPIEGAKHALRIQRNPESIATVLQARPHNGRRVEGTLPTRRSIEGPVTATEKQTRTLTGGGRASKFPPR